MTDLLICIVFTEAVVNLLFNGTVLQPVREFIIKYLPFLRVRGEHLLECKVCTSVWVGILTTITAMSNFYLADLFILGIAVHRCSNYLHTVVAILYDLRIDILVRRRKLIGGN